eukprot:SAG22_NODE_739_length_7523_cov_6.844558_4_plen_97_part_00
MTGLPDAAFRLYGGIETLRQNMAQNDIYIFRPCCIHPPGLPSDFYEKNFGPDFVCPVFDSVDEFGTPVSPPIETYAGAVGTSSDEEEEDPLCLWSM